MTHTLSKGQIKLWGQRIIFLLSDKMCEKLIHSCIEKSQDYKFNCFSVKNTFIRSEVIKNYYIRKNVITYLH